MNDHLNRSNCGGSSPASISRGAPKPAVSRRSFLKRAGTAAALAVGGVSALRPTAAQAQVKSVSDGALQLRSQVLGTDTAGHAEWQILNTPHAFVPNESAFILCDMWDRHWSRGATERVGQMAPRMNSLVRTAREAGVHIVHAPSDTMQYYEGTPARQRVVGAPPIEPPESLEHVDPLLPIDDSDGGSDTGETPWYRAWSRQHADIEIDHDLDGISDDGREIYSYLKHTGVETIFIMGVHTNMCVLNRSFGIKQLVRWGLRVILVRDLTDTMYNPAMRPYVSHAEGTRLVVGYIEKFWCPSVESQVLFE